MSSEHSSGSTSGSVSVVGGNGTTSSGGSVSMRSGSSDDFSVGCSVTLDAGATSGSVVKW
ncbi:hypothetical protein DVH05_002679 [Phytophthora capsici]|nr:hypothetical protein DVH05_002679 [Phytophthora capsici]